MKEAIRLCTCLFLAAFALAGPVAAQSPGAAAKEAKEEKPKTIAELVADSDRVDGLFTLFRDRKTGQVRMLSGATSSTRSSSTSRSRPTACRRSASSFAAPTSSTT